MAARCNLSELHASRFGGAGPALLLIFALWDRSASRFQLLRAKSFGTASLENFEKIEAGGDQNRPYDKDSNKILFS